MGALVLALVLGGSVRDVGGRWTAVWWCGLVAGTVVMAPGLLVWLRRPEQDRRRVWPVSTALEAVVAGALVGLASPALGLVSVLLLSRSMVSFLALLVLAGGTAWWVGATLHGLVAPGTRRAGMTVGAVAVLTALSSWATGGWLLGLGWDGLVPLLSWVLAMAAVVLGVRSAGLRRRGFLATTVGASAVALVSTLMVGAPLLSVFGRAAPAVEVAISPAAPPPTLEPVPRPEDGPAPAAGPTFGDLCHPTELTLDPGTPVPGGHEVSTTLTITNVGERQCSVGGWPSVRLLSDGEDLAVFVHVATVNPTNGQHVEEERVDLDPGSAAHTQIWWRSNGAAADLRATQELRLGIGGGEATVSIPEHAAWDVVRSSEAWLAPWQSADQAE